MKTFFCLMMLVNVLFAQGPPLKLDWCPPILTTTEVGDAFLNVHIDDSLSLVTIAQDGTLLASFGDMELPKSMMAVDDPVPTLTAQWCDADGVTHTVVTPIVSTTEQGLARALDLHTQLVRIMQNRHPPKPCPPPPPPPPNP